MGWSSGSGLVGQLIPLIRDNVSSLESRQDIYEKMIVLFESYDCDTLYECQGIDEVFDGVYEGMYPEEFEEE